jgi:hypothetical protein
MTGMTLTHEGRYYLFYGAMVDRVQRIGLAVSDDLLTWEKLNDPILEPAGSWYEHDPKQAINYETAWRDPYIFRYEPDNCFYALICARVADTETDVGGGCIAVARSENLIDWDILPPAYISDSITCMEVPEYFWLNGKHYITFTTSYHFGTPYPASDPYQASGTFYLQSDEMLTGYSLPRHDNVLSASAPQSVTNYVGRSIPDTSAPNRRLYYYHHVFPFKLGESAHGSLNAGKVLEADDNGNLAVRYAPVLEQHTHPPVEIRKPLSTNKLIHTLERLADGIVEVTANVPYAGICLRMAPQREGNLEGLAIWVSPHQQSREHFSLLFGTLHLSDGPYGKRPAVGGPLATRQLEILAGERIHLRAVFIGPFVDIYVNDQLCISHTFAPDAEQNAFSLAGAFYVGKPKDNAIENLTARRLKHA